MVGLVVSNLTERIEISDDCSFMRKTKRTFNKCRQCNTNARKITAIGKTIKTCNGFSHSVPVSYVLPPY